MILGSSKELLIADSALGTKDAVWVAQGKGKRGLIEGLDLPFGLAVWKDYLYVGEPTSIKCYKLRREGHDCGAGRRGCLLKGLRRGPQ